MRPSDHGTTLVETVRAGGSPDTHVTIGPDLPAQLLAGHAAVVFWGGLTAS